MNEQPESEMRPFELSSQLENMTDHYAQCERKEEWRVILGTEARLDALWEKAESLADNFMKSVEQMVGEGSDGVTAVMREQVETYVNDMKREGERRRQEWHTEWDDLISNLPPEARDHMHSYMRRRTDFHPRDEEYPKEPGQFTMIWEAAAYSLAHESAGKVHEATNRLFELATVLPSEQPSEAALRFLKRISRCYIWGFDTECVILCGGALENALRDSVTDEAAENAKIRHKGPRGFTLVDRIETALGVGVFDRPAYHAANRANKQAIEARHNNPEPITDTFSTIRDTLAVIEALAASPQT